MEKKEFVVISNEIKKHEAISKIEYWKKVGSALLDSDELIEKWCLFVEQQANDDFSRGALLDETLQIMSMIKLNVPFEVIAQTISNIPSGQTILDSYLSGFIHPEILDEIQSCLVSKKM